MKIKKRKKLLVALIIITSFGCSKKNDIRSEVYNSIEELAFSESGEKRPIVWVKERESYAQYLVLENNYGGNNGHTLLLRKNILPKSRRVNDYEAYYENSEIDYYLNLNFYLSLPEKTQKIILESNISILDEKSLNGVSTDVVVINRKVFLLSFLELGYAQNGHVGDEGTSLAYFNEYKNRIALSDSEDSKIGWWLRSADSTYDSSVYAVGPEGEIGSTNAFEQNGVRPAFCIEGKNKIYKKDGVYFLASNEG